MEKQTGSEVPLLWSLVPIALTVLGATGGDGQGSGELPSPGSHALLAGPAGPSSFVPWVRNDGQWDTSALFVARRGGLVVRLEPSAIWLQLEQRTGGRVRGALVRVAFGGRRAALRAEGPLEGRYHFFFGKDPTGWRTEVPSYSAVVYEGLFEGVDLRVRAEGARLALDWIVAAGADPSRIEWSLEGLGALALTPSGDLQGEHALGSIVQRSPASSKGSVSFRSNGPDSFGLDVAPGGEGDAASEVSTGLEWSTFFGDSAGFFTQETPLGIALGPDGSVTIGGDAPTADFPSTPGAFQYTSEASAAFVSRFDATGKDLIFSSLIGGSKGGYVRTLSVDGLGRTIAAGEALSDDFPTTPGAMATTFPEFTNTFILRLSSDGSELEFSTFLGGSSGPLVWDLAVAQSGAIVFAGRGADQGFLPKITPGAYDTTFNGGFDAFVARLNPEGSALEWATFLGGVLGEWITSVALSSDEDVIVSGHTNSSNFPTTPGVFAPDFGQVPLSTDRSFVSRFSSDGSTLEWSTFLGAPGTNWTVMALDPWERPVVAGTTTSVTYPVTPGAFDLTKDNGFEAFVTYFDPTVSSQVYSTYFGEEGRNEARAIHVDPSGVVTLAGHNDGGSVQTTPGAYQPEKAGFDEMFVARFSPAGDRLFYSTHLGTTDDDEVFGMVVRPTGEALVVGKTFSPAFPVTEHAYDTTYNGGATDIVLAQLSMLPEGVGRFGASTPSCLGPLSMGAVNAPVAGAQDFSVYTSAAPPDRPGFLLLSVGRLAQPKTVFGAALWVDLDAKHVVTGVTSDAQGFAEAPVRLPPPLVGETLYAQFVFLGNPLCPGPARLAASNALSITALAATSR